jgi:esterase/lipase
MYQGLAHFGNCFQYMYKGKSKEAIFIFHGFPSQKNRNKDIAYALSKSTNHTIIVHHYQGLGESLGEFTFFESLDNAEKFIKHHLKLGKYKKIHFVGHSWGGFISLNMLRKFPIIVDKIFLLSPFNQVPENKNLTILVDALFHEYPHCFFKTTKAKVKKDFMNVEKKYDLIKFLKTYTSTQKIKILQAKNDLAVPESTTRHLSQLLGRACKYQEVKIDHSFTEQRAQTIKAICEFFKNTKN